jgi:hypothetical protein
VGEQHPGSGEGVQREEPARWTGTRAIPGTAGRRSGAARATLIRTPMATLTAATTSTSQK